MTTELRDKAKKLIGDFKRSNYAFGAGVLNKIGPIAAAFGTDAVMVANLSPWKEPVLKLILDSIEAAGVKVVKGIPAGEPNSPREDIYRIQSELEQVEHDIVICIGGGSAIDAAKLGNVLAAISPGEQNIDAFLGTGKITERNENSLRHPKPLIAFQMASASASHLTRYANVTDTGTSQKMLVVDEALIPQAAVFDYSVTTSMDRDFTLDGAFDGFSHCLEVYLGAQAGPQFSLIEEICMTGMQLVLDNVSKAVADPDNLGAREALGLATDLGGYAIMTGSTNGGHLTSFSLVDIMSHGRACGIMNPYYLVLFAPLVETQLRQLGFLLEEYEYQIRDLSLLRGRELGVAIAEGLHNFMLDVGFPTMLNEIPGFSDDHIVRALNAARNPALKMKLNNMPLPLNADMVETHIAGVLRAAVTGNYELIPRIPGCP